MLQGTNFYHWPSVWCAAWKGHAPMMPGVLWWAQGGEVGRRAGCRFSLGLADGEFTTCSGWRSLRLLRARRRTSLGDPGAGVLAMSPGALSAKMYNVSLSLGCAPPRFTLRRIRGGFEDALAGHCWRFGGRRSAAIQAGTCPSRTIQPSSARRWKVSGLSQAR